MIFILESYRCYFYRDLVIQSPDSFFVGKIENFGIQYNGDQRCTFEIYFIKSGQPLPENQARLVNNRYYGNMFMHEEQFPLLVDVMRNEEKTYAWINTDRPELNMLNTSVEEIGEGDVDFKDLFSDMP